MRTCNKVILLGFVGRDPVIQHTDAGSKVARLSLATNRGQDEERRTDWHRLTCRGQLAQFVEDNVLTGDRIYVEGRIEYDSYDRDGVTIPFTEIIVQELVSLTPKPGR